MKRKKHNQDFAVKCSFCGEDFFQEDVVVLEEQGERSTFHATCSHCGTSAIVLMSEGNGGLMSLGMATDLDATEAKSGILDRAIDSNDVLDVYESVFRHGGDIAKLIK